MRINKSKIRTNNIIWLPVLLLLAACSFNQNTVYHSYNHVSNKGWSKSDTLAYYVLATDSLKPHMASVEIRNQESYLYKDIYLFISHNTKDSTIFITDTLHYMLADKNGKWLGAGLGTLFQSSLLYYKFTPEHSGNYTFKIAHGMKENLLKGISDVGLKIEKE